MHLSGDAKDLLYKSTILTAMMCRLIRVLFGLTFRKLTFQVNKINHKNVVKRGMYPMRRLSLVFAIRTCYKCHFSCTCTAQLDSDYTAMWPTSLCRFLIVQNLSVWTGATILKSIFFQFEQSMINLCVVALDLQAHQHWHDVFQQWDVLLNTSMVMSGWPVNVTTLAPRLRQA